ncbi:hypothetical protein HMPREF9148_00952 [Prevotella sp. F0091]|nr:hypothetical protein HMPREF9148_00952 [Prevotella sp. F0091]
MITEERIKKVKNFLIRSFLMFSNLSFSVITLALMGGRLTLHSPP